MLTMQGVAVLVGRLTDEDLETLAAAIRVEQMERDGLVQPQSDDDSDSMDEDDPFA